MHVYIYTSKKDHMPVHRHVICIYMCTYIPLRKTSTWSGKSSTGSNIFTFFSYSSSSKGTFWNLKSLLFRIVRYVVHKQMHVCTLAHTFTHLHRMHIVFTNMKISSHTHRCACTHIRLLHTHARTHKRTHAHT